MTKPSLLLTGIVTRTLIVSLLIALVWGSLLWAMR